MIWKLVYTSSMKCHMLYKFIVVSYFNRVRVVFKMNYLFGISLCP